MAPTPGMKPRNAARAGLGRSWRRYGLAPVGGGGGGAAAGTCSAQKIVPCAECLHSSHSGLPQERQKATAWVSGWFGQVIRFPLLSFLWRGCAGGRLLYRQPLFIHGFLIRAVVLTLR